MNRTARDLLAHALELPDADRAELAAELIASLEPEFEQEAWEGWAAEIGARVAELDSGKVECVPWSTALRTIVGRSDEPADG